MRRNWRAELAGRRTLSGVRGRLAGHGWIAAFVLLLLAVAGCGSEPTAVGTTAQRASSRSSGDEVDLDPAAIAKARAKAGSQSSEAESGSRAKVVVAVPPGMASEQQSLTPSRHSQVNRAKEDAQIEKDLAEFRKFLATIPPASGDRAEVTPEGQAAVPFAAPQQVATVVQAAMLTHLPAM